MMKNLFYDKVFSVLEINTAVSDLIQNGFKSAVWVCGEIQGFRPDRNKRHIYFDLIQKSEKTNLVVAKVKAALFAGRQPLITKRILSTNGKFDLKNDIEVKFLCEVSLHAPTGNYSLVIIDVDPVYTLGKLAETRQKIIAELTKSGIMEKNKTLNIPDVPLSIGLITAYDSAAYHDFLSELNQSGYSFKVKVINAHMQGKLVEKEVIAALEYFQSSKIGKLDVLVITRGGGAVSDLAWFDNIEIAKAVALSSLPVISALGHQIDLTITDLVANTTAKTPTKAAALLVEKLIYQEERLNDFQQHIGGFSEKIIKNNRVNLEMIASKFEIIIPKLLKKSKEIETELRHRILGAARKCMFIQTERHNNFYMKLAQSAKTFFTKNHDRLLAYRNKARYLDPKIILKRGYTLTKSENKIIKTANRLKVGSIITTIFHNGEITSKVEKKEVYHE